MGGNLIPVLDPDGKLLARVDPHLNKLKSGGFTVEPLLFRFGDESIEIRAPEVTGQVYDSRARR